MVWEGDSKSGKLVSNSCVNIALQGLISTICITFGVFQTGGNNFSKTIDEEGYCSHQRSYINLQEWSLLTTCGYVVCGGIYLPYCVLDSRYITAEE